MKKQMKLALSLLLAQPIYMAVLNANAKACVKPVAEKAFVERAQVIAKEKNVQWCSIENLSLKDKEAILVGIIERLVSKDHPDKFIFHADMIHYLFTHGNTTPNYKALAEFLKKHRNCNSSSVFLKDILTELQAKASDDVKNKVKKVVLVSPIQAISAISSKLSK